MANRIETARNYLVSVAERTIGVKAYREVTGVLCTEDMNEEVKQSYRKSHQISSGTYGIFQILTPATSRFFVQTLKDSKTWERSGPLDFLRLVPDLALIGATVYLSHNPLEFVAMKLATNAATHVGLDLASVIGKGTTRIFRHFRPSGTTLAI